MTDTTKTPAEPVKTEAAPEKPAAKPFERPPVPKPMDVEEIGGPPGPEPTRYGDWQFNGKVTDF
ncbi:MAG: DUF1674 domain-containing protein [Proteobacteria bacterium]|nr:DUF1674 domain-containing protein [Pseudomonadota bacterium]